MTVSAHDVAVALRERLPGLPSKKLHKLLYYAQGHHLAAFGEPLFAETISAWDMGPVVGQLWKQEKDQGHQDLRSTLTEGELNTIGYVVSRYGSLTGNDLENLTHGEAPWQRANLSRRPGSSARIELEWMTTFFQTTGAADDDDEHVPLDSGVVGRWLAGAHQRRHSSVTADSREELRARLSPSA